MKEQIKLALVGVMLMFGLQSCSEQAADTGKGIRFFEGKWAEALAKAKAEHKPLFVDAYATWCGPCKALKRNVFTDEEVGAYYNEHFINVAIDVEKGEGVVVASQYKIGSYPTLLFVDGDGVVVKRVVGYHDPEEFLALGKQVVAPGGS